jgi:hypothetical protein
MNIVHGNSGTLKTPIQMDLVKLWKFTPVSDLEFVMKDGNVIKIASYKSIDFDIEPVPAQTNGWDMEKTLKFGGATYGVLTTPTDCKLSSIYLAVVHSKGIILFDSYNQKEIKYPIANIHTNVWLLYPEYKHTITFWDITTDDGYLLKDIGSVVLVGNAFKFIRADTGEVLSIDRIIFFTADTELSIPSSITLNPDGTITMNAGSVSHTFSGW